MTHTYRPSFLVIVSLIFLLPLFFVPGGMLDLGSTKTLLISLGVLLSSLLFLYESFRLKEISLPKHYLMVVTALLPLIYLLSALLATPTSLALFGYNLEVGTFGYILLGSMSLVLTSVVFSETARALKAVLALYGSLTILALFVLVKILTAGEWLILGNFFGPMGNPLGAWTDLALAFGLLSALTILALGMLPMKTLFRVALYALLVLSTALLLVINFSLALYLTLGASVVLFFYFQRVESKFASSTHEEGRKASGPTWALLALGFVSLLFIINPSISESQGRLSDVVSQKTGVANAEARPTLSTTLNISKAVLSQDALLGSGPNTFSNDWLAYKPADVNSTPFWSTTFLFGAGFIPTQISATGIAGSVLWLAFYLLLLSLAFKLISQAPEGRAPRFVTMAILLASLYVWVSALMYTPSSAGLMLGFILVGALLAMSRTSGLLDSYTLSFRTGPNKTLGLFLLGLVTVGVLAFGWAQTERTLAAVYFQKAVNLSNVENTDVVAVEEQLLKAINYTPLDTYYRALSTLNFSQAQTFANSATGTPETNREAFEELLGRSISASRAAVSVNPSSYVNWTSLGAIFSSLVPKPFELEGAYENAQYAFNEAYRRNPASPEIPLLLAQLEINKGNVEEARSYIRSSVALKGDYADAYILLTRLEVAEKNLPVAIASAERLASLLPDNAGVHFELGLLKQANADHTGAITSFTRALELSPEYANAKYYLALSLAQLGDRDGARLKIEELLLQEPENETLLQALEALK